MPMKALKPARWHKINRRALTVPLRHPEVWTYLLLVVVSALPYLNTLGNGFVFDDNLLITVHIQDVTTPWRFLMKLPWGGAPNFRPIQTLSYAIDFAIGGTAPTVYHLSNLLYHTMTVLLVFHVVRLLTGAWRAALLVALLFGAHPIQTESVAYITGRRDLLSTLFYLLGLLAFIRYRESGRRSRLAAAIVAYLLAVLSKEMAITLPLVWLTYDLLRMVNPQPGEPLTSVLRGLAGGLRRFLRESGLLYLTCLLAAAAAAARLYLATASKFGLDALVGSSLPMRLLTSARGVVHYIKLLLFPATLNADYSYNAFPMTDSWGDPRAWLALLTVALLLFGLLKLLTYSKMAAFGGLWFFITLLPASQLIPLPEKMAEHYLYLPSVGVALLVGMLLDRWAKTPRATRALAVGFSVVLLLFVVRTVVRNRDWKDEVTLWRKTVQTAPACARAHYNLAAALMSRGDLVAARRELETLLQLIPDYAVAHHDLGIIAEQEQRYDDARREYETALRLAPEYLGPRVSLAKLAILADQLDDAEEYLEETLRIVAHHPEKTPYAVYYYLGVIHEKRGELAAARGQFELATRADPGRAKAYRRLGMVAAKQGDLAAAAKAFEAVVRLLPASANDHYNLALIYQQQGWALGAQQHYEIAVRLRPDLAQQRESKAATSLEVDEGAAKR